MLGTFGPRIKETTTGVLFFRGHSISHSLLRNGEKSVREPEQSKGLGWNLGFGLGLCVVELGFGWL